MGYKNFFSKIKFRSDCTDRTILIGKYPNWKLNRSLFVAFYSAFYSEFPKFNNDHCLIQRQGQPKFSGFLFCLTFFTNLVSIHLSMSVAATNVFAVVGCCGDEKVVARIITFGEHLKPVDVILIRCAKSASKCHSLTQEDVCVWFAYEFVWNQSRLLHWYE